MAFHHRQQPLHLRQQLLAGCLGMDAIAHQGLVQPGTAEAGAGQAHQQVHILSLAELGVETTHRLQGRAAQGPGAGQHRLVVEGLPQREAGPLQPGLHQLQGAAIGLDAPPGSMHMGQLGIAVESGQRLGQSPGHGAIIGIQEGHQGCPRRRQAQIAGG